MAAMDKAMCIRCGIEWTAERERTYYKELIKGKKLLFDDLCIIFPFEIKEKFYDAINKGNHNIEVYLDNLCHSYIEQATENQPQPMYDFLLSHLDADLASKREITNIIGRDGFNELKECGLIEFAKSINNKVYYQIR